MGKALLIFVLALSTLFSTGILNLNRHSLESVNAYSDHYRQLAARNAAVSGVYMSFSKLYQDSLWRSGFNGSDALLLDGTVVNVNLVDSSGWRVNIESAASYENLSDTIWVVLRMPPEIGDLAIIATDFVDTNSIETFNDSTDCIGDPTDDINENPDLMVWDAPEMIPIDRDSLINLAIMQEAIELGHIITTDVTIKKNWPANESFYWDYPANTIPNVTHVMGNLKVQGNATIYGIFIVEEDVILEAVGTPRVEGILYLPNYRTVNLAGTGIPGFNIVGGIVCNGNVIGSGDIEIQYDRDYMEMFMDHFQESRNLYILSWTESNFY
jgi:hypothetical protein